MSGKGGKSNKNNPSKTETALDVVKSSGESDKNESGGEAEDKDVVDMFSAYIPPTLRRQIIWNLMKTLPPKTKRCVKALRNTQLEQLEIEVKFYEEVFALQKKYHKLYEPLYAKRNQILNGEHIPTDAECEEKTESKLGNDDKETAAETLKLLPPELKSSFNFDEDVQGIPNFWLTVFRHTEYLCDIIYEADEEVLKKLTDVKLVYCEDDPMSYVINFHFAANEYFTDSILTKKYFLRTELNSEEPFAFEGPEIYKCTGCDINWNKGMNLTVKTIKKKQKHKARNAVRTVTKQVPAESFFHFFNPPVCDDISKLEQASQNILTNDFEIGHIIRERVIPKATLYFTGEICDDDMDEEDEEEEDEEEEEDDDDDDGPGPRHKPSKKQQGANPAECPQQ